MDPQNYQYSGNLPPEAAASAFAIFGGLMLFFLIIGVLYYVYYAICLTKIAKKTNTENIWLAWIPILNLLILPVLISKKPVWWIVLLFIPLANIVIWVIVWMAIAETLKKPNWLGILMLFAPLDLIAVGMMAFSENNNSPTQPAQ
jgi:hypothetical protein